MDAFPAQFNFPAIIAALPNFRLVSYKGLTLDGGIGSPGNEDFTFSMNASGDPISARCSVPSTYKMGFLMSAYQTSVTPYQYAHTCISFKTNTTSSRIRINIPRLTGDTNHLSCDIYPTYIDIRAQHPNAIGPCICHVFLFTWS